MRVLFIVPIVFFSLTAAYAANDCKSVDISASPVPPIDAPSGATSYAVLGKDQPAARPPTAAGVVPPTLSAGQLKLEGQYLDALRIAQQIIPFQVVWTDANGKTVCKQDLAPIPAGVSPATPTSSAAGGTGGAAGASPATPSVSLSECMDSAKVWIASIAQDPKRKRTGSEDSFTAIVFSDSGAVCYRNRDYGVTGDPIYVGLVTRNDATLPTSVSFTPCELEKEEPSVRVDAGLDGFKPQAALKAALPPPVSPLYEGRVCFNREVTIEVAVTPAGKPAETWRYAITQHIRYRATAQVGILSTDLHKSDFVLITDTGGTQRVFDKGPVDSGPEWYANVVIYGIAHYLHDLGGKTRYQGRDILHDQSWGDRLGLFFGVSLNEPTKRVSAGFSFELLAGVNALGGYERARVNELVGLNSGDPFPGSVSDLPIRDRWDGGFRWGVALDLRYLIAIFQRK